MRVRCSLEGGGISILSTFVLLVASLSSAASSQFTVYTVNYPLQYFAQRIAGDTVKVVFPTPSDVDPALWKPDVATIGRFQKADLILLNGANYAKWVKTASLPRSRVIDTSRRFRDRYIQLENLVRHTHGPGGEHAHGDFAFTTWLNFRFAADQAKAIERALIRKLPAYKEQLKGNYIALEKDLLSLDGWMKRVVGMNATRPLVASHPVYEYLARRYDLNLQSVHWEPDTFPGPRQWVALKALLQEHRARWLMWEDEPIPRSIKTLKALGVNSVVFRPAGNVPPSGDFLSTMQRNIENLIPVFE